jgi:hypothetical protein
MPDPPPRKRGGQPGNRNRLRHGRYAAVTIERRKDVTALGRLARHALTRVKMILRARKALKRVRSALPAPLSSPASLACEACEAREGDPGRGAKLVLKSWREFFYLYRYRFDTWVPFPRTARVASGPRRE